MSNFERNAGVKAGAQFFRDGKDVKFIFAADPATVVGPRLATEADKLAHADAWAGFQASEAPETPADEPKEPKAKLGRPRKVKDEPADDHSNGG